MAKPINKIEKLIAELCPERVEFKKLANLVKITTGKLNANAMKEGGKYPFFTCTENLFQLISMLLILRQY